MSDIGFVYVLENYSMPGVLKIGMTMRSPSARAAELSGVTGVPEPFTLIYYAEVENPKAVEAMLHSLFSHQRVSENREFFKTDPADVADALYEHAYSYWMDSPVCIAMRARREAMKHKISVSIQ